MRMVGEASNGNEAVQLHRQLNPDVTLMDLQMFKFGRRDMNNAGAGVEPEVAVGRLDDTRDAIEGQLWR